MSREVHGLEYSGFYLVAQQNQTGIKPESPLDKEPPAGADLLAKPFPTSLLLQIAG
jgi:hypothetical protein